MNIPDKGRETPDPVERAHLADPRDQTYEISRYLPSPEQGGWIGRFWVPVWDVPPGEVAEQRVLQYPLCLGVTTPAYSRLAGPTRGLSVTPLVGRSWAFGVMFRPGAGLRLARGPVSRLTDTWEDLDLAPGFAGLTARLRAVMEPDPGDPARPARARAEVEAVVATWGEPDEESHLVNLVVERVETDPTITTVARLSEVVGVSERSLQRLASRRLGLSPLWLIRRRRLHEAAGRLREGTSRVADVAAELGYADQAHLSRDFRRATGYTPAAYLALNR